MMDFPKNKKGEKIYSGLGVVCEDCGSEYRVKTNNHFCPACEGDHK